jgi:hypothetical protein
MVQVFQFVGYTGTMSPPSVELPTLLINGPRRGRTTVILAHGAGTAMDTEFMDRFAGGLADHDLRVVRFEFPYMAERRRTGKRRPPDREPVLRNTWCRVIDWQSSDRVIIGGKSMGGRIASLIADEAGVAGLVCLGYPFHPAGKSAKLRIEHLQTIETPTLIVQGERDPFGSFDEVRGYPLAPEIQICWLADGDHGFKPRKSSGRSLDDNIADALTSIATFVDAL